MENPVIVVSRCMGFFNSSVLIYLIYLLVDKITPHVAHPQFVTAHMQTNAKHNGA